MAFIQTPTRYDSTEPTQESIQTLVDSWSLLECVNSLHARITDAGEIQLTWPDGKLTPNGMWLRALVDKIKEGAWVPKANVLRAVDELRIVELEGALRFSQASARELIRKNLELENRLNNVKTLIGLPLGSAYEQRAYAAAQPKAAVAHFTRDLHGPVPEDEELALGPRASDKSLEP